MDNLVCTECGIKMTEQDARVEVNKSHPLLRRLFCYNCYIQWTLAGRPAKQKGYARVVLLLIAFIFALIPMCAGASVTVGTVKAIRAPICQTEAAAIEAAKLDATGGPEATMKYINDSPDCDVIGLVMKVVRSVFKAKTERGETSVVEVSIELGDGTSRLFYILVDVPVLGEVTT